MNGAALLRGGTRARGGCLRGGKRRPVQSHRRAHGVPPQDGSMLACRRRLLRVGRVTKRKTKGDFSRTSANRGKRDYLRAVVAGGACAVWAAGLPLPCAVRASVCGLFFFKFEQKKKPEPIYITVLDDVGASDRLRRGGYFVSLLWKLGRFIEKKKGKKCRVWVCA